MKPLVVKLGGSLVETGRLRSVLSLVCRAERPVVVVPGGGAHADAVRTLQNVLGIPDETAHAMAILAMNQMGLAMVSLERRFVAAETFAGMRRALSERRIPVWLPARLCANDRLIPRSWTITSDGLAARLAERLGGSPLVLVKSVTVETGTSAETLAEAQVIDSEFPAIVRRASLSWTIVGPGQDGVLAELLSLARHSSEAHGFGARTRH